MADFDRNGTVRELDRIAVLYDEKNNLERELSGLAEREKEESYEKVNSIADGLDEYRANANKNFGVKTPVISYVCRAPLPPDRPVIKSTNTVWLGAFCGVAIWGLLLLYILLCFLGIGGYVTGLFVVLILGSVGGWIFLNGAVSEFTDWKKAQAKWERRFDAYSDIGVQDQFLNECAEYEKRFLEVVADCTNKVNEEREKYDEWLTPMHEEYAKKRRETRDELDSVTEQLNAVTLIQPDLFDNAAVISKLIRTGRADSLKEAINLAFEEERKDRQERERREEAKRQEAILEEQANQTRMHEYAMEEAAERQAREAREHAAAMEAQVRAQMEETEKIRKELEKQNAKR